MCVLSHFSHVWLFATLWTIAYQAILSMGFSRQKYWSRLPYPPPGDLPDLGIELTYFMSPALAGRFFTASATWEALRRKHRSQTLCNTGLRKDFSDMTPKPPIRKAKIMWYYIKPKCFCIAKETISKIKRQTKEQEKISEEKLMPKYTRKCCNSIATTNKKTLQISWLKSGQRNWIDIFLKKI